MKRFTEKLWLINKLIRPILPLSGGIATWIISRSCGASLEAATAASCSIALSMIGASFYHYGGANWMYARKSERLKFQDPESVRLVGLVIFCISIAIATVWLPPVCVLICLFNTVAIAAYSAKLSSHWTTKNLTMAVISTTPVVIGWQAGTATHPIVVWAIAISALAHLSREIVKDVKDIIANEGKRVTLPMVITKEGALQLSGIILLVATVLPFFVLQFTDSVLQSSLLLSASLVFLLCAILLIVRQQAGRVETFIHVSICLLLLALV